MRVSLDRIATLDHEERIVQIVDVNPSPPHACIYTVNHSSKDKILICAREYTLNCFSPSRKPSDSSPNSRLLSIKLAEGADNRVGENTLAALQLSLPVYI